MVHDQGRPEGGCSSHAECDRAVGWSCRVLAVLAASVALLEPAHAAFNSFARAPPASVAAGSQGMCVTPAGLALRGSRVPRTRGAASLCQGLVMLRRSDKRPKDVSDDKWGGGEKSNGGQQAGAEGIGDWKIAKNKAPGIVNAASDIKSWILRAQIERDEDDPETLAIASEFEFAEEEQDLNAIVGSTGGAAGRSEKSAEGESESWFRNEKIRDKDPSGVIARAEKMIDEAEAMNMSYVEYVQKFVKKPVLPNVDLIRPNARIMPEGVCQFVSTPHAYPINTLMPRVPYCTCWYGLFFEVQALDRDLEVVGLHTQTGMYWRDTRDVLNVSVYTCEEDTSGKETAIEHWQQVGAQDGVRMARVNFTMNSNPTYARLPFGGPVLIKAGSTRGFLIHTSHDRGIVLRAKEQGSWEVGEITDADDHIEVHAGLLPCGRGDTPDKVFQEVYSTRDAAAFVGVVDYRVL